MHEDLLNILDRKLLAALQEPDSRAEQGIRSALKSVGPDPRSPFVSQLMTSICDRCAQGLRERGEVALEVVRNTIAPHKTTLDSTDGEEIIQVVKKHFPTDKYVELVSTVPSVFERRQSSPRKFQQAEFDLQLALVKASACNMSTRAVSEIKLLVDEMRFEAASARDPLWEKLIGLAWHELGQPAIRWAAGILAAVVAAYLAWYFGLT